MTSPPDHSKCAVTPDDWTVRTRDLIMLVNQSSAREVELHGGLERIWLKKWVKIRHTVEACHSSIFGKVSR